MKAVKVLVVLYAAFLTGVLVSAFNVFQVRSIYFNYLALIRSEYHKPHIVFIGDSLIANNTPWPRSATGGVLNSVSVTQPGAVVEGLTLLASSQSTPKSADFVVISAGMNNSFQGQNALVFGKAYRALVNKALSISPKVIVTLITPTQHADINHNSLQLNRQIQKIAKERGLLVVDLSIDLSRNGFLLPQYTVDGVHLSRIGYKKWEKKIRLLTPYTL